ncbi:hypothetical protein [Cardinium endosymbiont of Nabis limbatus]|uniref:hypothetical protein n=1 Tax=Cardinium endosymbiont of Nabis limbatus TaxID=3066217 RepID=UPI003AF381E7
MKGIKRSLMAGLLACATFNAQAEEVSPFEYGLNAALSVSSAKGYGDDVKFGSKKADSSLIGHPWVAAGLYAEYAFADQVGLGIDLRYMKQGATLKETEENSNANNQSSSSNATKPSISMVSHGVNGAVRLFWYPLGRQEEAGMLKVSVGVAPYIPFKTTCTEDSKDINLDDTKKKEISGFDLGVSGLLGYQFTSIGLGIELKYDWFFMNKLKIEEGKNQTIYSSTAGLKELGLQCATIGINYNLASLFSE